MLKFRKSQHQPFEISEDKDHLQARSVFLTDTKMDKNEEEMPSISFKLKRATGQQAGPPQAVEASTALAVYDDKLRKDFDGYYRSNSQTLDL